MARDNRDQVRARIAHLLETYDAVLPEYGDERLEREAKRTDYYGETCRQMLRLPAGQRQAAWAAAHNETTHTPIEMRGDMMVSGMTQITGDMNAALTRIVDTIVETITDNPATS